MPIINFGGTVQADIGKLHVFNGTDFDQIGKVYGFDGTDNSLIYSAEQVLENISLETAATSNAGQEVREATAKLETGGGVNATITGTFKATVTKQNSNNFRQALRLRGYKSGSSTPETVKNIVWSMKNASNTVTVNETLDVSGYAFVDVVILIVAATTSPTHAKASFTDGKIVVK